MPSRIIYLPIEPYKSRYSQYTSVKDGVYETCFKNLGINFLAIRPDNDLRVVNQGQVLDVFGRTHWGFMQIRDLVRMIVRDEINPKEDVIYLEDFWTPGFEQIMYAQSSKFGPAYHAHTKVYSFCHAQTLDPHDFTYSWQWWMRPLEKAWMDYQTKVFCAAREMITYAVEAGFPVYRNNSLKLIPVGHAFNKEAMLRIANLPRQIEPNRDKRVVWASRWDAEKNPGFFMDLMEKVLAERDDVSFAICTGQPQLKSNDPSLLERLYTLHREVNTNRESFWQKITIVENISLREYYCILKTSKVLFNSALQDWISYVLLDATINGCAPLFPRYLTFPDALNRDDRYLYTNLDLDDAKRKLYALLDSPTPDLSPIYSKYEDSITKMCRVMGFQV